MANRRPHPDAEPDWKIDSGSHSILGPWACCRSNRVDDPNAKVDVVLDQQPPEGAMVAQGSKSSTAFGLDTAALPEHARPLR